MNRIDTTCCIAGGGPAGMVLGFLLARAGVEVVVLEQHGDFLRDFRGDTIHPSTLEVIHELGLLDDFLARPHQAVERLRARIGDVEVPVADFTHLPTRCRFIAFMPQWEFLDFIKDRARRYPGFRLLMHTEVNGLIRDHERVVGVRAHRAGDGETGELEVRADLVVGADGRASSVRAAAALPVVNLGAPMDVLWMRLPREPTDPEEPVGNFGGGGIFIMIYRGDYWQCGYVIRKGGYDAVRDRGLPALRQAIADLSPMVAGRVGALESWDDVKLLAVSVDRLRHWHRPGLLCIGDAAHAMSPVGGVGINLAVQDAVAAANLLAQPLRERRLASRDLGAVQRRRELPARLIQRVQVIVQNRVIPRVLARGSAASMLPLPLRLMRRWPRLTRLPARLIGLGIRPEHVRTPDTGR